MKKQRTYHVYILTNRCGTLNIGVTGKLAQRSEFHSLGQASQFTARYRTNRLIYTERFTDVFEALAREKQLKGWRREKKIALIESLNPKWITLEID